MYSYTFLIFPNKMERDTIRSKYDVVFIPYGNGYLLTSSFVDDKFQRDIEQLGGLFNKSLFGWIFRKSDAIKVNAYLDSTTQPEFDFFQYKNSYLLKVKNITSKIQNDISALGGLYNSKLAGWLFYPTDYERIKRYIKSGIVAPRETYQRKPVIQKPRPFVSIEPEKKGIRRANCREVFVEFEQLFIINSKSINKLYTGEYVKDLLSPTNLRVFCDKNLGDLFNKDQEYSIFEIYKILSDKIFGESDKQYIYYGITGNPAGKIVITRNLNNPELFLTNISDYQLIDKIGNYGVYMMTYRD